MKNNKLGHKVALVTGGGRGIGRAIALSLAEAGCWVAVVARTSSEVQDVVAEITTSGGQAAAYTVDIANGAAIRRLHEAQP